MVMRFVNYMFLDWTKSAPEIGYPFEKIEVPFEKIEVNRRMRRACREFISQVWCVWDRI